MYAYLGRFAPFHLGHKMIVDKMIYEYGIKSCLLVIGSANVLDNRTPFTYSQRCEMIKSIYPKLLMVPIDDVNDDMVWLRNMHKIEKKLKTKLTFLGGSRKDLEILSISFDTHVLVDRVIQGGQISATQVRTLIKDGKWIEAKKLLPEETYHFLTKSSANIKL